MTTNSPPSNSEGQGSSAFERFHEGVRRWVWDQGWTALRPVQERAAEPILNGSTDVIISAPTAGGKTEAAFLPIASRLAEADLQGLGCVCVSPLKALINDQADRLTPLFERVGLPLTPWHGDVAQGRKQKLLQDRRGVLLITPESLEALFVLRGSQIPRLFQDLRYVVVDELHSFIDTERGRQLQSLLNRVEPKQRGASCETSAKFDRRIRPPPDNRFRCLDVCDKRRPWKRQAVGPRRPWLD